MPSIPAYIQIKEYYQHLIDCGALKEGEYLPSVREVSLLVGVNPNTVQRAFSMLVDEGYLTPINGKGNRINAIDKNIKSEELKTLLRDIEFKGYSLEDMKKQLEILIKEREEKKDDKN